MLLKKVSYVLTPFSWNRPQLCAANQMIYHLAMSRFFVKKVRLYNCAMCFLHMAVNPIKSSKATQKVVGISYQDKTKFFWGGDHTPVACQVAVYFSYISHISRLFLGHFPYFLCISLTSLYRPRSFSFFLSFSFCFFEGFSLLFKLQLV